MIPIFWWKWLFFDQMFHDGFDFLDLGTGFLNFL